MTCSISLLKRDKAFIVLMAALPGQEVVIAAALFFREGAASLRAVLVDGAVPLGRVEKLASAFEDVILLVSQHAVAVAFYGLGEFTLGLFVTQPETLRQSRDVAFRDQYPVISATIGRAFEQS